MKINLITGASGFVGRYLIQSLLESGETVWVILRPLNGESVIKRTKNIFGEYVKKFPKTFKVIKGDLLKINFGITKSIYKELENNQIFFWHLAANLSFAKENKEDVIKTNIVGTKNAVDFANKLAIRFIHMSTAYVCGDSRKKFKESDLDIGQGFRNSYESSKCEAEKYVRKESKISYLIFRPSIIIGDAYEGKAEGCTFGYYRFIFMFYFLKKRLIKSLNKKTLYAKILKIFATKYDKKNNQLEMPWLILPCPSKGFVDMVPVDYVIDSMIKSNKKIPLKKNMTLHLVQKNIPRYDFLIKILLEDLGFKKVKLFNVHNIFFKIIFKFIYFCFPSIRTYTKSISWYVPYFTHQYLFDRKGSNKLNLKDPPKITKNFMNKVNTYAKNEILEKINIKQSL